jgi:cytochrome c-type biogenesis protein
MSLLEEFVVTFLLGLGAPLVSPCLLPLYPGFLAYLSGRSKSAEEKNVEHILGILVFLGVVTMMLFIGFIIASLRISVGQGLAVITPLSYVVIIILGVLLLFNKNIFAALPRINMPVISNPYVNAYTYGLLFGPIALPCAGPVAVSVFALSFTITDFVTQVALFFVFGLGFGMPLILIAFLAKAKRDWFLNIFEKNYRKINMVAGVLLIAIGVYELWVNWDVIQLFLLS